MKKTLLLLIALFGIATGFYQNKKVDIKVFGIPATHIDGSLTHFQVDGGETFRLNVQPHRWLPSPDGLNLRIGFDASAFLPYDPAQKARYTQNLHSTKGDLDTLLERSLVQDIALLPRLEDVTTTSELDSIACLERIFRGPVALYASHTFFHATAKLTYTPEPRVIFKTSLTSTPIVMNYSFTNGGKEIYFRSYTFSRFPVSVTATPIRPQEITAP